MGKQTTRIFGRAPRTEEKNRPAFPAGKPRFRGVFLLYALCGGLTALPMVFPALWFLSWIAPAAVYCHAFFYAAEESHPFRRAYGRGLAFFYVYGLLVFYWFVELYPLDFAGLDKWGGIAVVLVAWFGLPLLQAVFAAVQFVLLRLLVKKLHARSAFLLPPVAAALWICFEWLQTRTWAGVPWGKLALTQTGFLPLIQSASLLGPYLVAFLVILVSALLGCAWRLARNGERRNACAFLAIAVSLFCANLAFGVLRCAYSSPAGETITAAAIQANLDSAEKWDDDSAETLERHRTLTLEAAQAGADLILWPETALPYVYSRGSLLDGYLTKLAVEANTPIYAGFFIRDSKRNLYNVIGQVDPETGVGDTFYVKRRLVPFGEFVPMRQVIMFLIPPLAELSILTDDVTPGTDTALFETPAGKLGSVICFDSIYEDLVRESVRDGANLICISTNDSWFGDSAAVYQHNSHAKLRAVENGRYVVRAANTGISSIITPTGAVTESLPPLVEGYITGEVTLCEGLTLYTRVGNVLVVAAAVYLTALLLWPKKRRSHGDLH